MRVLSIRRLVLALAGLALSTALPKSNSDGATPGRAISTGSANIGSIIHSSQVPKPHSTTHKIAASSASGHPPNRTGVRKANSDTKVGFPASGPWLEASCDVVKGPKTWDEMWKAASGSEAWDQAMKAFKKDLEDPNGLHWPFDRWLWSASGGLENPRCVDPDSTHCTRFECGDNQDSLKPAGALMMLALSGLQQMVHETKIAMDEAHSTVNGVIGEFRETFTRMPDHHLEMAIVKMFIDAATFSLGIGSAFVWNVFAREAQWFTKDDNLRSAFKDISNAGIAFSAVAPKDHMKAKDETLSIQNLVSGLATEFIDETINNLVGFLNHTVYAQDDKSQSLLHHIVADGIGYSFQTLNYVSNTIKASVLKLFYGKMIPQAWSISVEHQEPFILRVPNDLYKCGDPVEQPQSEDDKKGFNLGMWMTGKTAKETQVCLDDAVYFVLNARYDEDHICDGNNTGHVGDWDNCLHNYVHTVFGTLAGGDSKTLDGEQWGGVTLKDMLVSSMGAFVANGFKNGYQMEETSSLHVDSALTKVEDSGVSFFDDIKTPGFFNFTICFDPWEAVASVLQFRHPPCAESPKLGDYYTKPKNEAGYTAGWCTLHVSQYQKDAGQDNPLDTDQIAVSIFDDQQRTIGSAPKQPGDPAISIKSKLPSDLIVKVDDDDYVHFWYADQYWRSDDNNHQCDFKKFDGPTHKREASCGWVCKNPAAEAKGPPSKAPPKNVQPAYSGTGDGAQTAGAKSYKKGKCKIQIRQYQRNEMHNYLNPGEYSLEMALLDDKKNLIAYTRKTKAPPGKGIAIQGPLEFIVLCSTGKTDSDPISCSYGAHDWKTDEHDDSTPPVLPGLGGGYIPPSSYSKSGPCTISSFDGGIRDASCTFAC